MRLAAMLGLLLATAVAAHDLYVMAETWTPGPGSSVTIRFENGDGFPAGEISIDPRRLLDSEVLWANGQSGLRSFRQAERNTTAAAPMPAGHATVVITAHTEPLFIELDAEKFTSYLRHERLDDVIALRAKLNESGKPGRETYSKYVKSILRVGKGDKEWSRRTEQTIEIVPDADPYSVSPGASLPVRVYFQGAPAADLPLEVAFIENGQGTTLAVGTTDGQGRARVPIKVRGAHRLHTIKMERAENAKDADWISYWASLTFEVQ
jgi:hypothetical protein